MFRQDDVGSQWVVWCVLALFVLACSTIVMSSAASDDEEPIEVTFERKYKAWKDYMARPQMRWSSWVDYYSEPYNEIVGLGPCAVGCIVDAMEKDPKGHHLWDALSRITKKEFSRDERLAAQSNAQRIGLWVEWWRKGRLATKGEFDRAYAKWKELTDEGEGEMLLFRTDTVYDGTARVIHEVHNTTELGQAYNGMKHLGIDILPLVVEKLEAKEYDLLPLFYEVTGGQGGTLVGTPEKRWRSALGWWAINKEDWLLPPLDTGDDGKVER